MTVEVVNLPAPEAPPSGGRSSPRLRPLLPLQALRGVAALVVVVTHAANTARDDGFAAETFDLPFGNFGVDVFFVISGFIIVYSSTPLYKRSRAWATFIVKRMIRIVPLYWIVSLFYLLYRYQVGSASIISARYVLASYFFLPYPEPEDGAYFPFYFPGWTLQFEVFFYACFSTTLFLTRSLAVLAVSGMMFSVLALGRAGLLSATLDFWSSSLLLEFVAGCLVAEAYLRGSRLPGWPCLLLAIASALWVLVTSLESGGIPGPRGLMWGLPATALVAAVTLGPCKLGIVEAALVRLGDASYSLYIVHLLVIEAATQIIQGVFRNWHLLPVSVYMLVMIFLAVGAALLCFHFVERPLTRRLQRMAARP